MNVEFVIGPMQMPLFQFMVFLTKFFSLKKTSNDKC
jgi:hypothetical protein